MTTIHRSRREAKYYDLYLSKLKQQGDPCEFCLIDASDKNFLHETTHFKVIQNMLPYTFWDDHKVQEHLLVIPKQHTDTLSELPEAWAAEYVRLVTRYEKDGYNIYARPPKAKTKSVTHQHTHLIKISDDKAKIVLFSHRPYMRVMK